MELGSSKRGCWLCWVTAERMIGSEYAKRVCPGGQGCVDDTREGTLGDSAEQYRVSRIWPNGLRGSGKGLDVAWDVA